MSFGPNNFRCSPRVDTRVSARNLNLARLPLRFRSLGGFVFFAVSNYTEKSFICKLQNRILRGLSVRYECRYGSWHLTMIPVVAKLIRAEQS